jgi:hypothetical protein
LVLSTSRKASLRFAVTALRRQGPKECADKTDTLREEGMSKG